jgi:hypothetical protein
MHHILFGHHEAQLLEPGRARTELSRDCNIGDAVTIHVAWGNIGSTGHVHERRITT